MTDAEMFALYSKEYFQGKEYGDYVSDKHVLQKNFQARLTDMREHLNADPSCLDLIEVGCAYGFFLELASRQFRTVRGIDLSEEVVSFGRDKLRVDARAGDFLQLSADEFRSDVVCMWDTVEHLRSPHKFINHAADLLQPGGYLFITTGDITSLNARVRKGKWRLIHPPSHVHYFGRESIHRLLERCGFEIIEFKHVGFYRSVGNTFSNLFRQWAGLPAMGWLRHSRAFYYLNLYDIMFVAARRK